MTATCRGCDRPMVYKRGLCCICYRRPGSREAYPSESIFAAKEDPCETMEDLDRLVAQMRPTMPVETGDNPPRLPPLPVDKLDVQAAQVDRSYGNWVIRMEDLELTEETQPSSILLNQYAVVCEAVRELGPGATVEQVSDFCCLPVWNVTRLMGKEK